MVLLNLVEERLILISKWAPAWHRRVGETPRRTSIRNPLVAQSLRKNNGPRTVLRARLAPKSVVPQRSPCWCGLGALRGGGGQIRFVGFWGTFEYPVHSEHFEYARVCVCWGGGRAAGLH